MAARYPRSTVCILDTAPSTERFHASGGTRCQHTTPAVLHRSPRTVQRRSGRAEERAEEATLRYHLGLGPVYGSYPTWSRPPRQVSEKRAELLLPRCSYPTWSRPPCQAYALAAGLAVLAFRRSSKTKFEDSVAHDAGATPDVESRAEPAGLAAPLGQGEASCCPVG
jgi:hypothetical protein